MENIIKASDFSDFSLLEHSGLHEVSPHYPHPQLFSCYRVAIGKDNKIDNMFVSGKES